MTTEVVIANRQAIALAADSAVTVGKERVWKTANKLFSLGPTNDIGIMMNGTGDFLGISWEVIIKLYREHVGSRRFATVKECADDFIAFFQSEKFRNPDTEILTVASVFIEQMEQVKAAVSYSSKAEFRSSVVSECNKISEELHREALQHSSMTLKAFSAEWRTIIEALAKDVFKEVITKKVGDAVVRLMHATAVHAVESEYATGIVIAGFGSDEMFPAMVSYTIDGCAGDLLRIWQDRARDLNDPQLGGGYIIPFGQQDIVFSFMEGITLESLEMLDAALPAVLAARSDDLINQYVPPPDRLVEKALQERSNEEAYQIFRQDFDAYRRKSITNPVIKVLGTLPKEELADMAQALVELTSLRRRVESSLETVGGPVDVAVISKGDGFIWLRRKNYFDIECNKDFLYRRYGRQEVVR